MSCIKNYSKDALTFWAITSKLGEIFRTLDDKNLPADAIVIYRPSFGQLGSIGPVAKKEQLSAEFGECNAILGTQQAIYLVESKWDTSPETRDDLIKLKALQIRRHKIMRWYIETWRVNQPKDWITFVAQNEIAFQTQFPGQKMVPVDSRLAQKLEFVMRILSECGSHVHDVVLLIGQASSSKPIVEKSDSFSLVILEYQPLVSAGYFQILKLRDAQPPSRGQRLRFSHTEHYFPF